MLALTAQENQYEFAIKMLNREEIRAVLFTRKDSLIRNPKDDISPQTKVAFIEGEGLLGFYLPIYQLYGLSFTKENADSLRRTLEMVVCGEADVGVGILALVQSRPELRVLSDRAFSLLEACISLPP